MHIPAFMLCNKVIRKKMEVVVIHGVFFKALLSIDTRLTALHASTEVDFTSLAKNFTARNWTVGAFSYLYSEMKKYTVVAAEILYKEFLNICGLGLSKDLRII